MESPKNGGNSIDTSTAIISSSSTQKSPFSKFLNNLSPIKSSEASLYTQRFTESNFQTIHSVFSPTHLDLQQPETSFIERKEIAGSSSNAVRIPYIQKQVQSCSPSEGVGVREFLPDHPVEVDSSQIAEASMHSANDVPQIAGCFATASKVITEKVDEIIDVEAQTLEQLSKENLVSGSLSLVEASDDQSLDGRFDKILQISSGNIWDHVESNEFLENHASQVYEEASQHQRGIRRHLQFEASLDSKCDAALNCHTPSRLGIAVPFTIEPKGISEGQQAICSMVAHASYLGVDSVRCTEKGSSQYTDSVEDLSPYQDGSKGKRKRETYTDSSEGCKLCNCKRSKCLKLYCECFAAGIYCADTCACESCFNKPDYEDTVLDIRQQIELRNPLAFAPAIVKQANESPNVEDDGQLKTPSSARHKRGCKCKRSKCLKKYCECYRAKVGCSDGCRCEDCDNSFGKKSESVFQRVEKWRNLSHDKLNTAEAMSDNIKGKTANQFTSTWEELIDVSHLNSLSDPHSRAVPSLTSANMENCPNVSQAQPQRGSGLQLSPGCHHWCSSALSPTQACVSKAAHELGSIGALGDIMGDSSPNIRIENTNPNVTVKSGSPNHKRVSPTKLQSYRLGSNSTPGLPSGHELGFQEMAPFHLHKRHCNSEDHMNQTNRGGSPDQ